MLKIENCVLPSVEQWKMIVDGTRNPFDSWDKSDSTYDGEFILGEKDKKLLKGLASAPTGDHRKFLRMINVYVDICSPFYWWKEFDTYKVGTVANSCSTMHCIQKYKFDISMFSTEHLDEDCLAVLLNIIDNLNINRDKYLETKNKSYWWNMIQLLPTNFNQKRTVMLNYETLRSIYYARLGHRLDEWETFREWIRGLPYAAELICNKND